MAKQSASVKIGADMPADGFTEGAAEAGLGELRLNELQSVNVETGVTTGGFPTSQETVGGREVVRTTDGFGNIIETVVSVDTRRAESPAQVQARAKSQTTDQYGNVITSY